MGLEALVHEDKKRFEALDQMLGMNPCGGKGGCGNEEALEDLLGAMTANYFVKSIQNGNVLDFNQLVYGPNTTVEKDCGFDHSIGLVNSSGIRVHLQYKLLREWCDTLCDGVFLAKSNGGKTEKTFFFKSSSCLSGIQP